MQFERKCAREVTVDGRSVELLIEKIKNNDAFLMSQYTNPKLQSDIFDRLKIGIAIDKNMRPSENYVLKPFPRQYQDLKNEVVNHASNGIDFYLKHDIDKSMNNFNKRNNENGK